MSKRAASQLVVQDATARGAAVGTSSAGREEGRRAAHLAAACLTTHADWMSTEPKYRAGVERLIELLSERPGVLGRTVRRVADGHATLTKVL